MLLLVREGPAANRDRQVPTRRPAGYAGHSRRRRTVRSWSGSRRPATFSSPRATGTGFWTGPTSTCRMVGFDDGAQPDRILDGKPVVCVHANLRADSRHDNREAAFGESGLSFMGDTKGGAFDIRRSSGQGNASRPERSRTPKLRRNCTVDQRARRYHAARAECGSSTSASDMSQEEAARYEQPFAHVDRHVRPERETNKRQAYRERWWIHVEARPAMRSALRHLGRFLATTTVSKHRLVCLVGIADLAGPCS